MHARHHLVGLSHKQGMSRDRRLGGLPNQVKKKNWKSDFALIGNIGLEPQSPLDIVIFS